MPDFDHVRAPSSSAVCTIEFGTAHVLLWARRQRDVQLRDVPAGHDHSVPDGDVGRLGRLLAGWDAAGWDGVLAGWDAAGWDGVLAGLLISPPDCNNTFVSESMPHGDCGSGGLAVAYLVTYLVISFLVIINMYIAVILENFSQVRLNSHLL